MSANTKRLLIIATLLLIHLIEHYIQAAAVPSTDAADVSSGKYNRRKYSQGKYKPTDEGAWMDSTDKWRYRHYDDGDRGQYIHIDIPYDGGYGNYEGGHEIYRTPGYDSTGEYSNQNPFETEGYFIPKPAVPLLYGLPGEGKSFQRVAKNAQLLGAAIPGNSRADFDSLSAPSDEKPKVIPLVKESSENLMASRSEELSFISNNVINSINDDDIQTETTTPFEFNFKTDVTEESVTDDGTTINENAGIETTTLINSEVSNTTEIVHVTVSQPAGDSTVETHTNRFKEPARDILLPPIDEGSGKTNKMSSKT